MTDEKRDCGCDPHGLYFSLVTRENCKYPALLAEHDLNKKLIKHLHKNADELNECLNHHLGINREQAEKINALLKRVEELFEEKLKVLDACVDQLTRIAELDAELERLKKQLEDQEHTAWEKSE